MKFKSQNEIDTLSQYCMCQNGKQHVFHISWVKELKVILNLSEKNVLGFLNVLSFYWVDIFKLQLKLTLISYHHQYSKWERKDWNTNIFQDQDPQTILSLPEEPPLLWMREDIIFYEMAKIGIVQA